MTAVALAALSAAVVLGFDAEFRDGSYVVPVLGAALLPHAIGWLARKRRWPGVALGAGLVAALLLYATWTTGGDTAAAGLPGPDTLGRLASLLRDGWEVLRTGVAPVAVSDGALLLTIVAVFVMAAAADAIAFSADASIGAMVPSLMLFVIASSLGPKELRVASILVYVGAALVFLLVRHRELLEQRRAWFVGPRRAGTGTVGVGATIGVGAIVAGLLVGPALPGAEDPPLLDYRRHAGAGAYQSRVNPLVDVKSRLTGQSDAEVFTVHAPTRLYWRLVALDSFDGTQWTLSSSSRRVDRALTGGRANVRQQFSITGLDERWLPAAYEPVAISLRDASVVPESRTLVAQRSSIAGLTYTVDSAVAPEPDAAQVAGTAALVPGDLRRFVVLPRDFPSDVRALARGVAIGPTPYDRARALETFFTDGSFTYDLDVPPGSSDDAIRDFLRVRRGFCEQFAGTFAAMARAVGLPSRVAVGFSAGTYDAAGRRLRVTGRDAHAWPEVWLSGLGWTRFEPTPSGTEPGAADPSLGAPATAPVGRPTGGGSAASTTPTAAPAPPAATAPTASGSPPGVSVGIDRSGRGTPAPGRFLWLAAAAAALATLAVAGRAAVALVSRARRRSRRRARDDPRGAVLGAWAEALDRLDEQGCETGAWRTPAEVVASVADRREPLASATAPLGRLADAAGEALWAPTPPDGSSAWADLAELERLLRAGSPWATRARRVLNPLSRSSSASFDREREQLHA